ncbi:hypothetical protein ACQEV4_22430 [Streptomyces shenzhenensis]|uniref:hypothetical protein n=1 Tax=Streptomyces shenzhenensis TaxID=943815 RepID=UPI003D9327C5
MSNPDAVPGEWHWVLFESLVHGDTVEHLVLPAFALAIGRVLRSWKSDYVRTARSKGLKEPHVFARHVLRNSVDGGASPGVTFVLHPVMPDEV